MPDVANRIAAVVDRRYRVAFALTSTLFLSWALASSLNDVLIRQFQKALDLSRTGASFIQMAFYIGYFCAPLPAAFVIRKFGYKRAMLCGLALYAVGAFLFVPAAHLRIYGVFLMALYIIAIGVAFLETSANPYIAILGAAETGSARLNFAQAFNGVGAVVGPIVGGRFILSGLEYTPAQLHAMSPIARETYRAGEALTVQGPYIGVGLLMCLIALSIALTRYPSLPQAVRPASDVRGSIFAVLRHPRLVWAVVAQFFYVGAQVGIWSFFIDFSKEAMPSLPERTTAYLLSGSLLAFTIGRFSGAWIQGHVSPARQLALYAAANIILCVLACWLGGVWSVGALWLTSFFMSVMFPTIFALGVEGLGHETEFGSSFLVMSIVGGAVVPPLMALISDRFHTLHVAMIVPAVCFAVCLVFGLLSPRLGRRA